MLICRNDEGVHGQRNVGNPCTRERFLINDTQKYGEGDQVSACAMFWDSLKSPKYSVNASNLCKITKGQASFN